MKAMNDSTTLSRSVLRIAVPLLLLLSACDTLVSESGPRVTPRGLAQAPALSVNAVGGNDSLIYQGLFHRPTGHAALHLNPAGHLVVSNIGSSGQDGVMTELPSVRGLRRTFAPIDLSEHGATASWRAYGSLYPDSLPPLVVHLRLQNQGGTVNVGGDFSALAPMLTAQVYNDASLVLSVPVQAEAAQMLRVEDIEEGLVLKGLLSSPMGIAGYAIAAEVKFAHPVAFDIQDQQGTGDRLRLVLPNSEPVALSGTVWRFTPPTGTSAMVVVSTDVEVLSGGS